MKTKLFTLLLTIIASTTALFASVQIGNLYYNLEETNYTAEVTYQVYASSNNYIGLTSADIPSTIAFQGHNYCVISIGEAAFFGCSNLTSITIPNSVTSIGNSAFESCPGLTSVTIPNSVTSIGDWAFYGITNVLYDGTAAGSPWGALCHNGYIDGYLLYSDNTKTILLGCLDKTISEIILPSSVTSIGDGAFEGCSSLTSITIPNSVTSIGSGAFWGCSGLTSFIIPNSVTSIGRRAFDGCQNISEVFVPSSVQVIGANSFANCTSLHKLIVEGRVETTVETGVAFHTVAPMIENSLELDTIVGPAIWFDTEYSNYGTEISSKFKYIKLTFGELTESVVKNILNCAVPLRTLDITGVDTTSISEHAFVKFRNLDTLRLPLNLQNIPYMAIAECVNLKCIDIPSAVTSIAPRAFENCRSLNTVNFLGTALESIGSWAFYNAHALQNIAIPDGVTSIGDGAFYGCHYLDSLSLPASLTTIGDNGFAQCSHIKKMEVNAIVPPIISSKTFLDVSRTMPVYVPDASVNTYKADIFWGQLNIVGASNQGTTLDNASTENAKVLKVFHKGQLYIILPDGAKYSATGKKVQ